MDDEFLIKQTLAGKRQPFRLVVLRYERPLCRFLGLLGFRGAAAEEVRRSVYRKSFGSMNGSS